MTTDAKSQSAIDPRSVTDDDARQTEMHRIVMDARATRESLMDLDHSIQSARDAITIGAATQGRTMTESERSLRRSLRADQTEVRDAFTELALVTLARLDSTQEMRALAARLQSINKHVHAELQDLRNLENFAREVSELLAKVDNVTKQILSISS